MKDNVLMKIVALAVLVMITVALFVFLFTKGVHEGAITGFQALDQQGTDFWIGAILFSVGAGVITYFALRKSKNLGGFGLSLKWLIPVIVFVGIAWGKGCTDKDNDGVTAAGGRPIPAKIDSTRIPAEDLLPKK